MDSEERSAAAAYAMVEAIKADLTQLELAKYKYHRDIVTFMDSYQGSSIRKTYWEEVAGTRTLLRHTDGRTAPSYHTLKCLYHRIKRIKDDNHLSWDQAVAYYSWGGLKLAVESRIRQGAPYLHRRRALRASELDT